MQIDRQGTRFVELTLAADKAVGAYKRKRDPKDAENYTWKYNFRDNSFKGQMLSVHFDAAIPNRDDTDDGVVRVVLPAGTIIGTTKK